VVASGGPGGDRVDARKYVDYVWTLADRHTITPEKARQVIDKQIAQHPAPQRPAGKKAPTGRLSRWFSSTKTKLAKFIDKARDYFNDAAVRSAGQGGWSTQEVRAAGMSGDLLTKAEALQAKLDAEKARQQQEAQAAEAARAAEKARELEQVERLKKMAEGRQRSSEKPQEPDIRFFDDDDDEPQGPGLG
jgi:hypothetical protein